MKRFARLFREIDQTTRLSEKTAALVRYFEEAPPEDAAWALWVLTGRRIAKGFTTRKLAGWALEATGLPEWMLGECYEAVGDFGEELALLLENAAWDGVLPSGACTRGVCDWPLHVVVEEKIKPLRLMSETEQRAVVMEVWSRFDVTERFLYHKLISGEFRVGAAKKLVIAAAAKVAGVEPAVMEHRLMGKWEPTAKDYLRLMDVESGEHDPGRPYPFFLAYQLDDPPGTLGDVKDWQIEWKWDGIRAQLIKRNGEVLVWSRGEELVTEGFPELRELGKVLPDGTVLDGEVLGYEWERGDSGMPTEVGTPGESKGRPLPFGDLQKRINRKRVEMMLFQDVPVVFMAYDVLEWGGEDVRAKPQAWRRALLEEVCARGECAESALVVSEVVEAESWDDVERLAGEARDRGVEGFMFKRKDAAYGVGRTRGQWWKWKVDPFSVDCVLVYAQRGNGKRASVYSDYTFAVWGPGSDGTSRELVPVTKAYSGLTDEEIGEVDRWVRRNAIGKHGPVRVVRPELVFEVHFEGIRESDRHRSGVALRFPRMHRWRKDKRPEEADTLETLRGLLKQQRQPVTGRR